MPEAQVDQQIALEEETEELEVTTTPQNEDVDLLVDHEQNVIELTEELEEIISETTTTSSAEINDADHETSDDVQTSDHPNQLVVDIVEEASNDDAEEEILETTTIMILTENNDASHPTSSIDQEISVDENFDEIFEADVATTTLDEETVNTADGHDIIEITTVQTNDEFSENTIQVVVSEEENVEEDEENNEEITTIIQDIDEILDDDTDAFEEDFGVDVQIDGAASEIELIFDPLDDIADGQEEHQKFPDNDDVEYVEVADHPEIASVEIIGETSPASVQPYLIFDHTTIAYPIGKKHALKNMTRSL